MAIGVAPLIVMVFSGLVVGLIVEGFKVGYNTFDAKALKEKLNKKDEPK